MYNAIRIYFAFIVFIVAVYQLPGRASAEEDETTLRAQAVDAMRRGAGFFHREAASHGGYVYRYSLDFERRWGEGEATRDQIWVQPPGTPAVGMTYLKAYAATGDRFHLAAAKDAAYALVYGQLESGGWQASIDFDPNGERVSRYRNGKGGGKNNSSLDDNQTQASIRFLVQMDGALGFEDEKIHETVTYALDAVLAAQFPNGGFPQVWSAPVSDQPIVKANYPGYDWRTEGRIKEYWDYYTLNDDLAGDVVEALAEAYRVYKDERYMAAIRKLGDFLVLAQMPDPQPAWAQQYNFAMQPMWARRFEPAAIASDESQEVIETLMLIYRLTGERDYLEPIPRALAYLKRSLLEDGRFARFYELKTNKPLYMTQAYELTYDDSDLPTHYAFKINSKIESLEREYETLSEDNSPSLPSGARRVSEQRVREIVAELDELGRWVSMDDGEPFIESRVFCRNIELLSDYVLAGQGDF